MRCLACNVTLNEVALRRKMPTCGEHWDLCGGCLNAVQAMLGQKPERRVYAPDPAAVWFIQQGFDGFGNARAQPHKVPD